MTLNAMMIQAAAQKVLLPWNQGTFANASERFIHNADDQTLFGPFAGGVAAIAHIGGKNRVQIEGARTNRINAVSAWTLRGACTRTAGQADPASGTGAYLIEHLGSSGVDDIKSAQVSATNGQALGVGCFVKRGDSSSVWTFRARSLARGAWQVDNALLSDDWERIDDTHPAVTVTTAFNNDGSTGNCSFLLHDQGADSDVSIWMPQMPDEVFLSSPILEATTRAADSLQFAAADIPAAFTQGKWSIEVTPMFSSADMPAPSANRIFRMSSGANDLYFTKTGGEITRLTLTLDGATIFLSSLAWSRDQTMTITLDVPGGELSISGCTSGDGTVAGAITGGWATDEPLYVGAILGTSGHLFGRISEPVPA